MLDPKSTWLPILQCLLSLQSSGKIFKLIESYYVLCILMSYSEHLQKVLDNSDLNLATEMHLLLNSSTGTIGHFRNLIMGEISVIQ